MPSNQTYTIQQIREGTTTDQNGRIILTKVIKYMVGNDGPFTLTVPPGQNNAAQIAAMLQAAANEVIALRA